MKKEKRRYRKTPYPGSGHPKSHHSGSDHTKPHHSGSDHPKSHHSGSDHTKPHPPRPPQPRPPQPRPNPLAFTKIKKYKFKPKFGPFLLALSWVIFVILGLSTLEFYFRDTIKDISTIFFIISLILGIYLAYPVVMWIDRSLSYTDFGLWCRRIISGALVIIGGVLSIGIFLATSIITVAELQGKGPIVTSLTFTIFIAGFFIGLAIFAGYLEFVFERKAGILIFTGNQKF